MAHKLMLVDDEPGILNALRRVLTLSGCHCNGKTYPLDIETFASPQAALARADAVSFDLVISDYRMPDMDGVTFLKALRAKQPDTVCMILSGYADLNGLIAAINEARIFRFIAKPWNDYELVSAIGQALAWRELQQENQRLADEKRLEDATITPQEWERRRLEAESPGITQVQWTEDGCVLIDADVLAEFERRGKL